MKIDKLTEDQELKVLEYRNLYWERAVCCEKGDHGIAEEAALGLAKIGGVKNAAVHWVLTPCDADSLMDSLMDSLLDSLMDSLMDSFLDSLRDSLKGSLKGSLKVNLDSFLGSPCLFLNNKQVLYY